MCKWTAALLALSTLACQADGAREGRGSIPGLDRGPGLGTHAELDPRVERGGPRIHSLRESVEPLREEFNRRADQRRVVVLLSATEGPCALGARAVRESVLESYPDADLWIGVVWVDMQPSDCARSVDLAARRFVDRRVEHFHDPQKRAGRAFARGLLPTGVAWDVYLFYPPGARWDEDPPRPLTWSHQLGRIAPETFHPREMLFEKLHESMAELLAAEGVEHPRGRPVCTEPPSSTRWAGLDRDGL